MYVCMYTRIINCFRNLTTWGVRFSRTFTRPVRVKTVFARFLPRVFQTYNENWVGLKLMPRKGFCTLDPCLLDIYRKHPKLLFRATIRFCFFVFTFFFICCRYLPWFSTLGVSKKQIFGHFAHFVACPCTYVFAHKYRANLGLHTFFDGKIDRGSV